MPDESRCHHCDRARRALLLGAVGFVLAPAARGQATDLPPIAQPPSPSREVFMRRAFDMRRISVERGDQAYGAVIVKGGKIVGEGVSAVITANDPTAHAEMQGIRDAARRLGTRDLSGCEMYGTSRACPMCEAGAYWARISRMYYGEGIADAGEPKLR
ncbi:MAG TPA: nucleoside deaminase [Burkholderiales bacterium]|jgi:tRNA(Arg) A34 adenosine deaminase TadA|nr:nucleoside deaminase [Burkholderiales bacterium]